MSDVDSKLQGLDGFDKVASGEAFVGTSGCVTRGFQVAESGTFTYIALSPKGVAITFTDKAYDPPSFIGGPIYSLTAGGGGEAAVFPTSTSYTIA